MNFFDSTNSSYKSVLKKKKPSTYHEQGKSTVEGRSGDKADKSQRQFQKLSGTSFFCLSQSLLPSLQKLVLVLQWGETGSGCTNSAQLWLFVANSFSPGLEDEWFNNPECCALCFSKVDSLHSASLTGVSHNLLGKCWTNRDRGSDARGWPCIVCFLL